MVAERHSGHVCVTASVDSVHFLAPAKAGETLIVQAACNRSWTSSMEIGVKVSAENTFTRELRHIVSAYLTFVALDEHGKPQVVPALLPETPHEHSRFAEAEMRREARLATAKQLRAFSGLDPARRDQV